MITQRQGCSRSRTTKELLLCTCPGRKWQQQPVMAAGTSLRLAIILCHAQYPPAANKKMAL